MKKNLKSLDEHNSTAHNWHMTDWSKPQPNGIACPECGEELMDTNPMITLTSMPPKKNIHCPECKYVGYRYA